jgi:dienelactone hydrolase
VLARLPADAPVPFRAAVAYGVVTPLQARVPLLMLLAGLDDVSWTWACQALVKQLPDGFPVEVRLYPAARHAFDVPELPPLMPWGTIRRRRLPRGRRSSGSWAASRPA